MTKNLSAKEKVQQARVALVLDNPFFGVLALRLTLVEDPGCGTAWTDGVHMGFDPDFVNGITSQELLFVVAHEVMHCTNGHPWRRDNRQPERWNYACDYAINHVLAEAGFKLFDWVLRNAEYDGKSAEWVYARLPKDHRQQARQQAAGGQGGGKAGKPRGGQGDGAGQQVGRFPGAGGSDVRDAPAEAAAAGVTEADWQQAVQAAAVAAKACGNLPACLERYAKHVMQPRVDWRSVLHRFVQAAAREDYSWRAPNSRYVAQGLYMPSMQSETVGSIAVAVDTSGSIDAVLLSQFCAELRSVADDVRPSRIHVIYCDATVHTVDTFERDDQIEIKAKGGGGTSFAPVMDWCDTQDEPPVALIYLTDMDGHHRAQPPGMPVLWATPVLPTGRLEPPYGEVVVMQ